MSWQTIYFRKLRFPTIRKALYKKWKDSKDCNILDVGCGSISIKRIKGWFPNAHYYELDIDIPTSSNAMDKFYHVDLLKDDLSSIPNNHFNIIILSHVIEHLPNGLEIIEKLIKKLKINGDIYIEFPSTKSLSLWSADGTLNFCDDHSHVRVYDIKEIANLLLKNNVTITKAGTAREWLKIFILPLLLPYHLLYFFKTGRLTSKFLWDITGFASYIHGSLGRKLK
jgi:SAM-dependent methyltransferase